MTQDLQQQSFYRKITYLVLIVALLTANRFYLLPTVTDAATKYELQETNLGEVDLGGSAARFALTAFRGPLVCWMWSDAIDRQKRHEYDKFELVIEALTKLQPHFKGPWRYQAWNLAFNVSVEFDRVQDKYFYIAEGVRWLTRGERVNRQRVYDWDTGDFKVVGDPDLRGEIAFYLQDKMTVSDETAYYRCMFPLSCFKPGEWNPADLDQNPGTLRRLKDKYPQWTRLRELKRVAEGADELLDQEIRTFLGQHWAAFREGRYPSLYQYVEGERRDVEADGDHKFPVWPLPDPLETTQTWWPRNPDFEREQSPYAISRSWYEYAALPLPPPEGRKFFEISQDEKRYYRMPKGMMSLLFRNKPALTLTLEAEQLGKDGWFERGEGDHELVNAGDVWAQALRRWLEFGKDNGLEPGDDKLAGWEKAVKVLGEKYPQYLQTPPSGSDLNDPAVRAGAEAMRQLSAVRSMRNLSNYDHQKEKAKGFATTPDGKLSKPLQALRHYYQAQRLRTDPTRALAEFDRGNALWMEVLRDTAKVDPRGVVFLLGVGPCPQLRFIGSTLVPRWFDLTPFGADHGVQEELVELQDNYLHVKAKADAPTWLVTGQILWELTQHLGGAAAAPGALRGVAACVPTGQVPLALGDLETALEMREGPLDVYLMGSDVLGSRGVRADRQRYMIHPSAAPDPGAESRGPPRPGGGGAAPPETGKQLPTPQRP
jgi:hypothetical protein